MLLTELSAAYSLFFYLARQGILIWVRLVKDQEAEARAGVAVATLAASAGFGDVFHFPTSVSRVCEELRFPVLQTKK